LRIDANLIALSLSKCGGEGAYDRIAAPQSRSAFVEAYHQPVTRSCSHSLQKPIGPFRAGTAGEPLEVETALESSAPESPEGLRKRLPTFATACEAAVFLVFAVFFILYGETPLLGGDGLGLVGADEPRYAQIAHEMLVRFDSADTLKGRLTACVTPYLYGHPWLEKPALYYWRAMFVFQDFGVHDWSARLPSASFAFIMAALIYLHMRRFRRGGHLDAALITVACAGIIGFSRGASTDMQMAAPFCIGLLGWYAWYETNSKFWLFDIYFFTGVATLAKGPVAPLLAILIVMAFAALRREWSIVRRSFWWPGVVLYFAIVLPWFLAVQHENPTFFREFFLEHNLERFATNRYEHQQPFWYYVIVVLLALMPWTVIAIRALVDGIQTSVAEWRLRHSKPDKPAPSRPGDAFPEFLVLWALIPIIFFTFSQSKLPGYILPSIPPITILTGDYLFRSRQRGLNFWVLLGHAILSGGMALFAFMLPWFGRSPSFCRRGAADSHRGSWIWSCTAAPRYDRRSDGSGLLPVRVRPVFRHPRCPFHPARDSFAGPLLLSPPTGRTACRAGTLR
jgi:4-amino-4-deoxy-L-arabinose transferase-like glycosyltransferase